MAELHALLARLASFSDADMERPWEWPGHSGRGLEARYLHWHCFQLEAAAAARAPAPNGRAAATMDLAQAAWGDLRGLLAGQDDALLDAPAASPGDWTLRAVLVHILEVERRYARQVRYATTRAESDPVYLDQPLELGADEATGGFAAWIERLESERTATDAYCRGLDEASLGRPTRWVGYDVDVGWRLERFAAHLAEHTIHLERLLRALGQAPGEARQATRRISALRGLHERRSPATALAQLDAEEAALAGDR